jgi:hypothetical protein
LWDFMGVFACWISGRPAESPIVYGPFV